MGDREIENEEAWDKAWLKSPAKPVTDTDTDTNRDTNTDSKTNSNTNTNTNTNTADERMMSIRMDFGHLLFSFPGFPRSRHSFEN